MNLTDDNNNVVGTAELLWHEVFLSNKIELAQQKQWRRRQRNLALQTKLGREMIPVTQGEQPMNEGINITENFSGPKVKHPMDMDRDSKISRSGTRSVPVQTFDQTVESVPYVDSIEKLEVTKSEPETPESDTTDSGEKNAESESFSIPDQTSDKSGAAPA